MKYIKTFMLTTYPVAIALLCCLVAYSFGQSSVRRATIVRSGTPYYEGIFFGKCAWDGEPWRSQQFCATDVEDR